MDPITDTTALYLFTYCELNCVTQVVNTAPPLQHVVFTAGPPNYMVINIVAMLFCCFFFGLIGIIYSMKVCTCTLHTFPFIHFTNN